MTGRFSSNFDEAEPSTPQPVAIKPAVADPGEYPLDALSPKLFAAAAAIVDSVQLPPSIAANSVLAAAALAVQPYVDVELPTKEVVPSSLFIATIAASGERKSSADKKALSAVRARERDLLLDFQRDQSAFQTDHAAYTAAKKKALTGNKNREQMRQEIEAIGPEPTPPIAPILISDEGTLQGLQKAFAEAMPALGLFSDEGGNWLGGYAMSAENRGQTGAALSKIWDGAPIKRVRGGEGISILRGRRLSVHLMLQHRVARKLFGDEDLKDQGLLSRILISQPKSLKGFRQWKVADANSELDLEAYNTRVYGLLSRAMPMDPETRELKPRVLPMSTDAAALWVGWYEACEKEMRPEGAYENISGFAAKLPEHAARIAAVMAFFENAKVDEISGQALAAGIRLAQFYAAEALRVIGIGMADQATENAATLIAWIRKRGERVVGMRWLGQQASPTSLRSVTVLRPAIEVLIDAGHLVRVTGGGAMADGKFFREAYTVVDDD